MAQPKPYITRGYCPRVFTPMESGDGLLVRVRSDWRGLSALSLRTLAQLAQRYGNGQIDLTRRANLQLRGVTSDTLAPLQTSLLTAGLSAKDGKDEARQLSWVSPLSGLAADCAELSAHAQQVEEALRTVELPHELSAKLLIVLDGGGARALDLQCDLRIDVTRAQPERAWLRAACEAGESFALGACRRAELGDVVRALLTLVSQAGPDQRMRDLIARGEGEALRACLPEPSPNAASALAIHHDLALFIGAQPEGFFGLGVPFGSSDATLWRSVAELAQRFGDGTVRLTPLRTLLLPGVSQRRTAPLRDAAAQLGLVVDASDVLLRVVACPGAPACAAGFGETRQLARSLAGTLRFALRDGATLHVSGCAKGCASSSSTDFTLVHDVNGAKLGRNCTARATAGLPALSLAAAQAQLRDEATEPSTPSSTR